jgi:hypothetical protein
MRPVSAAHPRVLPSRRMSRDTNNGALQASGRRGRCTRSHTRPMHSPANCLQTRFLLRRLLVVPYWWLRCGLGFVIKLCHQLDDLCERGTPNGQRRRNVSFDFGP